MYEPLSILNKLAENFGLTVEVAAFSLPVVVVAVLKFTNGVNRVNAPMPSRGMYFQLPTGNRDIVRRGAGGEFLYQGRG